MGPDAAAARSDASLQKCAAGAREPGEAWAPVSQRDIMSSLQADASVDPVT